MSEAVTETGQATTEPVAAEPQAAAAVVEPAAEPAVDPVKEPAKAGAPEAYEDFKLPEGVELAPETATELKSLAKELGLTQEQAQKLADLGGKQAQALAGQHQQMLEQLGKDWETAARADKDIGGDKLPESLATAKRALTQFGSPALTQLLEESRLGSHPEVIRMLAKIGKAVGEDKVITGSEAKPTKDLAQRLYG